MTSAVRRISAQGWFEFSAFMRNGETALLNMVMPVVLLVVVATTKIIDLGATDQERKSLALAAALTLAALSSGFSTVAIATGFDRRAGVLRYLGTTPLGRSGMLAGKALAIIVLLAIQIIVLSVVALGVGWQFDLGALAAALVPLVLGVVALSAWALLLAGTLRAETVLALANLIWIALLVGGGVLLIPAQLPASIAQITPYLPSGAIAESLREVLSGNALPLLPQIVLLGWLGIGVAATSRWFKWD